ncbi:MAG: general secretion pathway protein GspB [Methylococcaceae bacterium]|nr:general secretion pathway protein GspB [Methylococcaceae bacterium]
MSHTLNKLKQSEIDRGLRKRQGKKKSPSQGTFLVFFVFIISGLLFFINYGKDFFSKQQLSFSDQTVDQRKDVPSYPELKKTETKNNVEEEISVAAFITPIKEKDLETNVVKTKKTILSKPKSSNESIKKIKDKKKTEDTNNKLTTTVKKTIRVKKVPTVARGKKKTKKSAKPILWKNLSSGFKDSMPEMELNGIIFSKKEKNRYVFVNMIKYHVNDVIESGPTIEEISKNFIVLHYKNKKFTLPLK